MSRCVDASESRVLQAEWRVWLCAEARGDEKIQSEYGALCGAMSVLLTTECGLQVQWNTLPS